MVKTILNIDGWIKKLDSISGITNGSEWIYQPFILTPTFTSQYGTVHKKYEWESDIYLQIWDKKLINFFDKICIKYEQDKEVSDNNRFKKKYLNANFRIAFTIVQNKIKTKDISSNSNFFTNLVVEDIEILVDKKPSEPVVETSTNKKLSKQVIETPITKNEDTISITNEMESLWKKGKERLKEEILEIENRADLTNEQKVESIIKKFSVVCATIAIQPIPFADIFVLTPIQAYMGSRIVAIRGLKINEQEVSVILKEISGVIGLGLLAQQLAIGAYKTFIPFFGGLSTIPMVYGLTYAIGKVIDLYIINQLKGSTLSKEKMKEMFDQTLKEKQKEGEKNKEEIKSEKL